MAVPQLKLVFARAANGVIGVRNRLPWHLPEDLANFKRLTLGHPVIMGRKTWDSLPSGFRPLPGRINIVITRQPGWAAQGAVRAASVSEAMRLCGNASVAWIIGGAQIYAETAPLAAMAVVTELEKSFEGDAYAPQFGPDWHETARESHVSSNGLKFSFVTYHNTPARS